MPGLFESLNIIIEKIEKNLLPNELESFLFGNGL